MVRKKGLDIELDIVGEGPWKRKLEALVEEKGLGDCVTFHGQLDNREVMHMMAGADFFVMPSYPAKDPITAIAVGIVSGLAATGLHQAAKQAEKVA